MAMADNADVLDGILWLEIHVDEWQAHKDASFDFTTCTKVLEDYIRQRFASLQVGQSFSRCEFDTDDCHVVIEMIVVLGFAGEPRESNIYQLDQTKLKINQWHAKATDEPEQRELEAQSSQCIKTVAIPNDELSHSWKPLIFEDHLHFRLLQYMVRMTELMRGPMAAKDALHNWNRLCMLHGPPGGGKTTLCRALAHQLGVVYGGRTLLQIDCNDLLSKYFGESAKHVNKIFAQVKVEAARDHRMLVVLLDEVESIAGSRARLMKSSENFDGIRATNALLKMLDDLQGFNNVIILCTTNMVEGLDAAFIDRLDIKQHIALPSSRRIYDFFRSSLNDMASRRLFNQGSIPRNSAQARLEAGESPDPAADDVSWRQPILSWDAMHTFMVVEPSSNSSRVWELSQMCEGLSGRTLRRLPIACLGLYVHSMYITIEKAIAALAVAAREEQLARASAGTSA